MEILSNAGTRTHIRSIFWKSTTQNAPTIEQTIFFEFQPFITSKQENKIFTKIRPFKTNTTKLKYFRNCTVQNTPNVVGKSFCFWKKSFMWKPSIYWFLISLNKFRQKDVLCHSLCNFRRESNVFLESFIMHEHKSSVIHCLWVKKTS